jgi:hypothetical protein
MAKTTNIEYLLKGVRFSYLYCFQPYEGDQGDNFCSHFILLPAHPQFSEIVATLKKVAQDFWGAEWESVWAEMKAKNKICLKPGTAKGDADGYKGNYYISGNKKTRFRVIETRGGVNVDLTQADGRPLSGDYGNAKVAFYAMNHAKGGKMINCDIQGIQYTRKGAALGGGGRVADASEFGIDPSDADGEAPATAGSSTDVSDLMG